MICLDLVSDSRKPGRRARQRLLLEARLPQPLPPPLRRFCVADRPEDAVVLSRRSFEFDFEFRLSKHHVCDNVEPPDLKRPQCTRLNSAPPGFLVVLHHFGEENLFTIKGHKSDRRWDLTRPLCVRCHQNEGFRLNLRQK